MAKKTDIQRLKRALNIDENKLDKYLAYYQEKSELTPDELLMLTKYRVAWNSISIGRTYEMTLSMLMKDFSIQERQARYIITESAYIFGSVQTMDKQAKKVASANYYRLLSNMAYQNRDFEAAARAWEKADRLEGLYDEEKVGQKPEDFLKTAKFIFSSDTKVLEEAQKARERALDE